MHQITPDEFEEFIAELLDRLGFEKIIRTPSSGDGGIDVVATKHVHGIPITFAFQCKHYAQHRKIGLATLRELLGAVELNSNTMGVLITTSTFTKGAWSLISGHARLDGKNFDGIVEWLNDVRRGYLGSSFGGRAPQNQSLETDG